MFINVMQITLVCFVQPVLNEFMACGEAAWKEARLRLLELLSSSCSELQGNDSLMRQ
jgi:fumarylacetoacetase